MPKTRLYDRKNVSVRSAAQGQQSVAFASKLSEHPWSVGAGGSQDLATLIKTYPSVVELGRPMHAGVITTTPQTQVEITVPTGKFWRLIGGFSHYIADDAAVERIPVLTIETSASAVLDTITLDSKTASQVETDHFLFGTHGKVSGNLDVHAKGTLSIDEPMTAGDTFTIGTQGYIMVAGSDQPAHATRIGINMGADEAATKVNIEREFVDGKHPLVNAVDFTGGGADDDMVFTARSPGLGGDAIIFVEDTIANAANVLDGSGVLGGSSPDAADAADVLGTLDYPTNGVLLIAGDKIVMNNTAGEADDTHEWGVFGLEFDNDPR
jgi:hypothetical protein